MNYNIIVAVCNENGIGINNKLPWNKLNEDMKSFSKLTIGNKNNAVIMGKNTYNSIGKSLPNRTNIILSTTLNNSDTDDNTIVLSNIEDSIKYCNEHKFDDVWVIGGESIYKDFLKLNIINFIYQTKIYENYECDTYFPIIPIKYNIKSIEKLKDNNPNIILLIWEINHTHNDKNNIPHNNSFP